MDVRYAREGLLKNKGGDDGMFSPNASDSFKVWRGSVAPLSFTCSSAIRRWKACFWEGVSAKARDATFGEEVTFFRVT